MKQFFKYFLILCLNLSCVGSDTSFLPENIKEASEQKLLINIYKPNQNEIFIGNQTYKVTDAFTTFKTISKNDKNINKNFFAFVIKLKNVKTGKYFEYEEHQFLDFYDYINFYSESGGIHNSNLGIVYDKINLKDELDTIKIGFKNNLKEEKVVTFIKKK